MNIKIKQTENFRNKFSILVNKYPMLLDDIWELGWNIRANPYGEGGGSKIISKKGGDITIETNLLCRSFEGGNLRVIYNYEESSNTVEFVDIK